MPINLRSFILLLYTLVSSASDVHMQWLWFIVSGGDWSDVIQRHYLYTYTDFLLLLKNLIIVLYYCGAQGSFKSGLRELVYL